MKMGKNKMICSTCLQMKTLDNFYYRKDTNRYEKQCKECRKRYKSEYYQRNKKDILKKCAEHYIENRDSILKYHQEYQKNNKKKLKEKRAKYYKLNKENISEKSHNYYEKNRDNIIKKTKEYFNNNREKIYCSRKKRMISDELYSLKINIRKEIYNVFKRGKFFKNSYLKDCLGCDKEQFVEHLLNTFLKNYGYEWDKIEKVEIDHIVPLSMANAKDEVLKLCNYKNLQLLKKNDNKQKGTKLDWSIKDEK